MVEHEAVVRSKLTKALDRPLTSDERGFALGALDALVADLEQTRAALRRIKEQQPRTLETLRRHGVVFDGPLGNDPKNWQHVAFTIYTDLCEVDTIAAHALAEEEDEALASWGCAVSRGGGRDGSAPDGARGISAGVTHGIVSTYTVYGCRCGPCRSAKFEYMAATDDSARARAREGADVGAVSAGGGSL